MPLIQDLRHGMRLLLKHPGFSAISILTLALGIGLTVMMFSIVHGALLRGLPFADADRIMSVTRANPVRGWNQMGVTLHDLEEWREQQQVFESLATYSVGTFNVSGAHGAERYDGAWLSWNAFDVLGERPLLGRTFREDEGRPGAEAVMLIGHRMWHDRYGADPGIIGQTVRVNGETATIIGVMPERFLFPINQGAWLAERRHAVEYQRGATGTPSVSVFGRLRPGVSREQARLQMVTIARRLEQAYPETNENITANVLPFTEAFIGREPKAMLYTMLGAVFGVLLIACANVANLLLGRASLRAKEVGIRSALGASRIRIIAQFLTEPFALAAFGALAGLGVGGLGIHLFNRAVEDTNPPYWIDIRIDGTVLLFVLGLALFVTLAAGVLPAIRASGGNVSEALKDESRGASSFRGGRLMKALVVFEIALSVTLLVGAGLMIKSVTRLNNIDFSFSQKDVFTARIGLPAADEKYADDARRIRFFEEVQERLAARPGVRAAALVSSLPGLHSWGSSVALEGQSYERDQDRPPTRYAVVTPTFFDAVGVGILQGRGFGPEDTGGSVPVAIVNQSFVRQHFPGGDALGRRIRLGDAEADNPWMTVVGVVPDMHMSGPENEEPAGLYRPLSQQSPRFMTVIARTAGDPHALAPHFREAVTGADPDIPVYWPQTLEKAIQQETWFYRIFGSIFMILGAVALFLAAIGLYGVMSFSVSRRTREMGVRMALGASAAAVMRLIMRQGLLQLAIGVPLGVAAALGVSRLLSMLLFGVSPRDPAIFVATIAVLSLTGMLASWVPARRATRVDPLVALRYD
jgi:putative ABC transport system permease protein